MNMNQRLSLSTPWEGLQMTGQGFKPDPRNPAVRHYRGASRNVRQGETVNPPAIESAGTETPHLKWGALDFYPDQPLQDFHGAPRWQFAGQSRRLGGFSRTRRTSDAARVLACQRAHQS